MCHARYQMNLKEKNNKNKRNSFKTSLLHGSIYFVYFWWFACVFTHKKAREDVTKNIYIKNVRYVNIYNTVLGPKNGKRS